VSPVQHREVSPEVASGPYVSPLSAAELAHRDKELIDLLNSWESAGDEQEQRETLAVLSDSLGTRQVASSRAQFPRA
jgi:hypothetical protein